MTTTQTGAEWIARNEGAAIARIGRGLGEPDEAPPEDEKPLLATVAGKSADQLMLDLEKRAEAVEQAVAAGQQEIAARDALRAQLETAQKFAHRRAIRIGHALIACQQSYWAAHGAAGKAPRSASQILSNAGTERFAVWAARRFGLAASTVNGYMSYARQPERVEKKDIHGKARHTRIRRENRAKGISGQLKPTVRETLARMRALDEEDRARLIAVAIDSLPAASREKLLRAEIEQLSPARLVGLGRWLWGLMAKAMPSQGAAD